MSINLSTRELLAFVTLAEQRSFTRAAALTHLSQPAFSALIRALEASVGARLFDRYAGEQGLSLAVEVTLQPGEKSFTDADIVALSAKIVAAAGKIGATLRR